MSTSRSVAEEAILEVAKTKTYTHDEVVDVVSKALDGRKRPSSRGRVVHLRPRVADLNFSISLRRLREGEGITTVELCRRLESITGEEHKQSTYWRIESGEQRPRMREVQAVSLYFSVPIEELLDPPGGYS